MGRGNMAPGSSVPSSPSPSSPLPESEKEGQREKEKEKGQTQTQTQTQTGLEPLGSEIRQLVERLAKLAVLHLNVYQTVYERNWGVPVLVAEQA